MLKAASKRNAAANALSTPETPRQTPPQRAVCEQCRRATHAMPRARVRRCRRDRDRRRDRRETIAGTRARERAGDAVRSEEHTSELQSLMRISYAVFCLKTKK